jgi:hypothetical protein
MGRPKKEQTFQEAREEVAQANVMTGQSKLESLVEAEKAKLGKRQGVVFARVDSKGQPLVFSMPLHATSLSAQLVTKYQQKGFSMVYTNIQRAEKDDRVNKLFNATNYRQVPVNRLENGNLSIDEMNRQQLANEMAKLRAAEAKVDMEYRADE